MGPERFLPTPLSFEETPVVDAYHDLTPRMAATYDLFGNGKTALKGTLGKYLDAATTASNYGLSNPTSRIPQNVARTWTDADGDFVPDCDLLNPNAQDLRPTGGDACGAYANRNFGTAIFSNTIDPDILSGWGVRPSDWQIGVSVQHEVLPRVSVEVGYFWRWFQGFTVTDNLAVTAADFDQFSVTAPSDPRLPGGGNYTLSGFYDVKPALFGVTDNFITYSDKYGEQYQRFQGVDITASARPRNGLTIQGGVSWGRSTADSCEIRDKVPETSRPQPLVPHRHRTAPAVQDGWQLRNPTTGRPDQRDVHEQARHPGQPVRDARWRRRPGRQLHGGERRGGAVTRPQPVGERAERDGQPDRATHAARRSCQRDGHSSW